MVETIPVTYRVSDFRGWDKKGELKLQPKWQRRPVWHEMARCYLIDTMLRKLPIPPLYIRETTDPRTEKTIREVVDGQQRLRAVLDFLDGKIRMQKVHNPELADKRYSQLPSELKRKFLAYQFTVNIIDELATDADILDIFARINSYTLPLTKQEKRNAKWSGEFKTIVYRLARETLDFWRDNQILTERHILRMVEAELISELMIAMMDGLQDKKKSIDVFYKDYDSSFPQKTELVHRFQECLKMIRDIMNDDLRKTQFRKKVLFYSLFCAIYDVLYHLPKMRRATHSIPKSAYPTIRKSLSELSDEIGAGLKAMRTRARRPKRQYERLIDACSRQTDNIKPRRLRHKYIRETMDKACSRAGKAS